LKQGRLQEEEIVILETYVSLYIRRLEVFFYQGQDLSESNKYETFDLKYYKLED